MGSCVPVVASELNSSVFGVCITCSFTHIHVTEGVLSHDPCSTRRASVPAHTRHSLVIHSIVSNNLGVGKSTRLECEPEEYVVLQTGYGGVLALGGTMDTEQRPVLLASHIADEVVRLWQLPDFAERGELTRIKCARLRYHCDIP